MVFERRDRSILLVEDSDEDFSAIDWAWKKAGILNSLHRCRDGEDALDWLSGRGKYEAAPAVNRPALILLDLNLPRKSGREILSLLKGDIRLRSTPVVILTTSNNPKDVAACYDSGANSYVLKPVSLSGLRDTLTGIVNYWTAIVELPSAE